jgi:nucleotide-binding universal stress UspA family protein
MNVFCALMMITGSSGRSFLMRGKRSNAFSSGITTSVMTRSPSP